VVIRQNGSQIEEERRNRDEHEVHNEEKRAERKVCSFVLQNFP